MYTSNNEQKYELSLFDEDQMVFEDRSIETPNKTISDRAEWDSNIEREHIEDYLNYENVNYFLRLPRWFGVETPIGPYYPDFAISYKNEKERIILIKETKNTDDTQQIRPSEKYKISAGGKHFEAIGVSFDWGKNSIPRFESGK